MLLKSNILRSECYIVVTPQITEFNSYKDICRKIQLLRVVARYKNFQQNRNLIGIPFAINFIKDIIAICPNRWGFIAHKKIWKDEAPND
jgi:hypothetical protein